MDRSHLKGETGDRLNAVLCAAGYNIRWLLRMTLRKSISLLQEASFCLQQAGGQGRYWLAGVMHRLLGAADVRSTLSLAPANSVTLAASRLSQA